MFGFQRVFKLLLIFYIKYKKLFNLLLRKKIEKFFVLYSKIAHKDYGNLLFNATWYEKANKFKLVVVVYA